MTISESERIGMLVGRNIASVCGIWAGCERRSCRLVCSPKTCIGDKIRCRSPPPHAPIDYLSSLRRPQLVKQRISISTLLAHGHPSWHSCPYIFTMEGFSSPLRHLDTPVRSAARPRLLRFQYIPNEAIPLTFLNERT